MIIPALLFICISAAPVRAQTVTTVRIPLSATKGFLSEPSCTSQVKTYNTAGGAVVDSLRVRIEDDRNQPMGSPAALSVTLPNLISGTILKDSSGASFPVPTGKSLPGKSLTIRRDSVLVCAVAMPNPNETDTTRHAFRVGIGASFDFLSGLSATDLYSDLTVFLPRVWGSRFGIDAGLYNGRTTAARDTLNNLSRSFFIPRPARDSATVVRQVVQRARKVTYDQLGLYLAPMYKLTNNLYVGAHSEVIKRLERSETSIKVATADTSVVVDTSTVKRPFPPLGIPIPGDTTTVRKETFYDAFFGPSFVATKQVGGVELWIKVVAGVASLTNSWGSSFAVQFRVADYENGFKIGGEVRGPLSNAEPTMLVYLAKDWDFKRLANFLVGGNGGG